MELNPLLHYVSTGSREGLAPHPLFSPAFYRAQLRGHDRHKEPLEHYLKVGWRNGLSPHVLFDSDYYCSQAKPNGYEGSPLTHYLEVGWRHGFSPHPLFDPEFYVQSCSVPRDVAPLVHYLTSAERGDRPHYLFSEKHYRSKAIPVFPASAPGELRPEDPALVHYVERGAAARISTHELFDPAEYRLSVTALPGPERAVVQREIDETEDALLHYLTKGVPLGLSPSRLFVPQFYQSQKDHKIKGDPLRDYLAGGFRSASPHPGIDLQYYESSAPDFDPRREPVTAHVLARLHGSRTATHPFFDPDFYREANENVRKYRSCPVLHFLRYGFHAGHVPNAVFSESYVFKTLAELPMRSRSAVEEYFTRKFHDRRRILFVGHEAAPTGAPRILLRLVQEISADPEVECITILLKGGELEDQFRRHSHLYVMGTDPSDFGLRLSDYDVDPELSKVFELFKANPPAVAFCNTAVTNRVARYISGQGVPVVTLLHEAADQFPPDRLHMLYEASDMVIAPSSYVVERARRFTMVPEDKFVVRGQGLLRDDFGSASAALARTKVVKELHLAEGARIVLGCGTRNYRKGIDVFVEVAANLLSSREGNEEVHFVWIGGGPEGHELPVFNWARAQVAEGGLEARVHFIGAREDTEPYFLAADVFILTSRMDPYPCVVHEAMAASLPVVAFLGAGGAVEQMRDGGLAVPFNAGAMSEAVGRLLRDEELRLKLGRRGREIIARDGSFQAYVKDILELTRGRVERAWSLPHVHIKADPGRGRTIYFSAPDWWISGVNTFTEHLIRSLVERGFDARLLFTRGRYTNPIPEASDLPVVYIQPRTSRPDEVWASFIDFFRRDRRPCVYVPNYDYWASATSPLLPDHVGIVGIGHSDDVDHYEHIYRLGLYWDRIVSVSQRIEDEVIRLNASFAPKCSVIRYGVPFDREAASRAVAARATRSASDPIRLVYTGRFVQYQKRIHDYPRLARQLADAGVPFQLTMLGAGEEYDSVHGEMKDLIAAGLVEVPGRVSLAEVNAVLSEADIFLLLSEFEGLPLSMLEGMALGCVPVVVEMESGIPEVIRDGENGRILPRGDLSSLVGAIGALQRDRAETLRLSQAAVESIPAQKLDRDSMADQYAQLFEGVLAEVRERKEPRPTSLGIRGAAAGILPPPGLQAPRLAQLRGGGTLTGTH